jgi:hypothetical protein
MGYGQTLFIGADVAQCMGYSLVIDPWYDSGSLFPALKPRT